MEMSKHFVCCEKCFHELGRKKSSLLRLWMDLCSMYCARGGTFYLPGVNISNFRALEKLGFVVSTESNKGFNIKVLGHCISSDGEHCFCIKGGRHE